MDEQVMQQFMQEMRHGFQVIIGRLEHMDQRLAHVEQRLAHMDQRLAHVESTVDSLKQAVLETHETVVRMDEIQQQHAVAIETSEFVPAETRRLLETLTIKYMEHDADIRELKRAR